MDDCLATFVENQLIINIKGLFLDLQFCSIDLHVYSYVSTTLSWLLLLCRSFEIEKRNSSEFFFFKTFFATWSLLHFHTNFMISLPIPTKLPDEILIGIVLNIKMSLGNIAILIILCLSIHEHAIPLHLFRSSLIFFSKAFQFSVHESALLFKNLFPSILFFSMLLWMEI